MQRKEIKEFLIGHLKSYTGYGVYYISSIIDNKVYIGSSERLYTRLADHIAMLFRGEHHSTKLQEFMTESGILNLRIGIITTATNETYKIKEQYYINLFDSYYKGFNETPWVDFRENNQKNIVNRAKGLLGKAGMKKGLASVDTMVILLTSPTTLIERHHKKEKVLIGKGLKISQALKGRKTGLTLSPKILKDLQEAKKKKYVKSVQQFTLDNILVAEFSTTVEAAKSVGVTYKAIWKCCVGFDKTVKGYIWKYKQKTKQINE